MRRARGKIAEHALAALIGLPIWWVGWKILDLFWSMKP